jgi:hypothetical protein
MGYLCYGVTPTSIIVHYAGGSIWLRGQCYKALNGSNLQIFISYGVCVWQAFPVIVLTLA